MIRSLDTPSAARTVVLQTKTQTEQAQKIVLEFKSVLERTRQQIEQTEHRIATSDELIDFLSSIVYSADGP